MNFENPKFGTEEENKSESYKKEMLEKITEFDIIGEYTSNELARHQPEIALGAMSHQEASKIGIKKYQHDLGKLLEEELEKARKKDENRFEEEYETVFNEALKTSFERLKEDFLERMEQKGKKPKIIFGKR